MSEPTSPPPAWTVTGQQEITALGPTGSFQQGIQVSFITAKGVQASVFIPNVQYTADAVRKAITDYVVHLDNVAVLTSDS